MDEIQELDAIAEERSLFDKEKVRKAEISSDMERIILFEEVILRQKLRALWLREEDKNTKFFYQVANLNRRNNSIVSLVVDGFVLSDSAE